MDTNMKAELVKKTMINACKSHPGFRGAVCHSDYAEENTMPKFIDSCLIYKFFYLFFDIVFLS